MARGKKGRASNKKKKGKSGSTGGNAAAASTGRPRGRQPLGPAIPAGVLQGRTPDNWRDYEKAKALCADYPTVYSRYKQATNRFIDYMMDTCPEDVRGGARTVDALSICADWMDSQQHALPRSILRDLQLAIRLRSRVAKSVFGGGDGGHKHFNLVLTYCWTVLNRLPREGEKITEAPPTVEGEERSDEEENRYAALGGLQEEDEDMEDEDEEIFPKSSIPRPEPTREPMSLDELMNSEDRLEAILFLDSIDEMMGFVSEQYKAVTQNHVSFLREGVPPSALVEMFLEASVATNMMIQKVAQLEAELQAEHEHLTTPYRLLATLILPDVTRHITTILLDHSVQDCDEKIVSSFLGDCLECWFRNPSDDFNRKDVIVKEFCADQEVDEMGQTELQEVFDSLQHIVCIEVPIGPEVAMNAGIMGLASSIMGTSSHSWLPKCRFIGRDRSIHHTLRLLQMFSDVVRTTPENRLIVPKRGFFGIPWRPGRTRKIYGDLDELLMSDIMPSWVTMCRAGILGHGKLPRENEICPLLVQIRSFVENAGRPVAWSTTFAIHAMLTAILETDRISNQIIDISKQSFGMYFAQVKHATKLANHDRDTHVSRASGQNMFSVAFLENLGLPIFGDRTLWNPLCGGTILSYITYFGNLEGGLALVDCRSQLRITMHLYHALLVNNIVDEGQIPFLDKIYRAFRSCRAVWEGPLPRKGEFCQRFWMCFGLNAMDAKRMAQSARRDIEDHCQRPPPSVDSEDQKAFRTRKLRTIEPSELSTSFRRICDRDFRGVKDKYHTPEQRRNKRGSEVYEVAVRANDTLDAIDSEQSLLALNFVECGAQMEQFVCSLGRIMQWDPFMSQVNLFGKDKRQGFVYLFAQYLLGALDFANDPFRYHFLRVPLGEASASFMETYFNRVTPDIAQWWTPIDVED